MTFSVLLVKDDQARVVGTLWADDESKAKAVAPMLCGCSEGEKLNVRRAEDREIPLRLATPTSMQFC